MTIEIKTHTITRIQTTHNDLEEFLQIEKIYFAILSKILLDKSALMITIAPEKKYSLGYEISPFSELKIGKVKFLINDVAACSSSMLMEVSRSEEFNRGLLILIKGEKILLGKEEELIKHIYNNIGFVNLPYETIQCEDDGNALFLYNTKLSREELSHTTAVGNR